jgi:hypothetical protein
MAGDWPVAEGKNKGKCEAAGLVAMGRRQVLTEE